MVRVREERMFSLCSARRSSELSLSEASRWGVGVV